MRLESKTSKLKADAITLQEEALSAEDLMVGQLTEIIATLTEVNSIQYVGYVGISWGFVFASAAIILLPVSLGVEAATVLLCLALAWFTVCVFGGNLARHGMKDRINEQNLTFVSRYARETSVKYTGKE